MADDAKKLAEIQRLRKLARFQPLRFVNIFFSTILTLYGVGILLTAMTVKSQLSDYLPFLHYYLDKPVLVLILASVVLVCLSCLGIIASAQNIYQGIVTYGVLLFGLFMFELTMGAVFLVVLESADRSVTEALETHIDNYTEYNDPIDYIQTNLHCCGISDFTDWNSTLGYIPGSCCSSDDPCGFADIISLNETGCYVALKNLVSYLITYLIIILGILAGLQITAMIITFFLARGIADYRRRISDCIMPEGHTVEPEIAEIQNPLSLRNNNQFSREKERHESSSIWNANNPVPGKMMNRQGSPQLSALDSERKNSFQNPGIYRDVPLNYNQIPRHQIFPSIPQLPRAHRKFPVGF